MTRAGIDGILNGCLFGWYWGEESPNDTMASIGIDGHHAGTATATRFRNDLKAAGIGDGHHGFEFPIPKSWRDGVSHRFTIVADNGDTKTIYASVDIVCPDEQVSFIDGRVERLSDERAWGWAFDRSAPQARISIRAIVKGVKVGEGIADRFRPDLLEAGIGDGHHGFSIRLSSEVLTQSDPVQVVICAVNSEGETTLGNLVLPAKIINTTKIPESIADRLNTDDVFLPSPSSVDAPDKVGYKATLYLGEVDFEKALAKLRRLSESGVFLHAKFSSDMARAEVSSKGSSLALALSDPAGWVRVLKPLPQTRHLIESDWRFQINLSSNCEGTLSVKILMFDDNGSFSLVMRAPKIIYEIGLSTISFVIKSKSLKAVNPDLAQRPIFLCLESEASIAFSMFDIHYERLVVELDRVPFRNSELPVATNLASLNDQMSIVGKKDLDQWTLNTIDIAIRLECFDTASRLLTRISRSRPKDWKFQRRFISLFVEIAFATGQIDELRTLLLDNMSHVIEDDRLFTALSMCFPASAAISDYFSVLPSRKPNRSFISRTGLTSAALRACVNNSNDFDDGQTHLLSATIMKNVGPSCWQDQVNAYLRRFALTEIKAVDLRSKNVLETLSFGSLAPSCIDMGLVSVIMSAFNASETARYAIQSILNQTYTNIEILICDDDSRDDTQSVLAEFREHPRVRIFRSRSNQGPYNIRNSLMSCCKGRYVTFQDADDFAHPERIARQLEAMKRSGKRASMGRWIRVRPNADIAFFRDNQCARMCVVSLLCEREVFDEVGSYRSVLCGGDSEVFERLRLVGGETHIEKLDEPLIFGLWSLQSLTQQSGLEATEDGYRSAARRAYAEHACRSRLLGHDVIPSAMIDDINTANGIFREPRGIYNSNSNSTEV